MERFNRTLLAEWACVRAYATNQERTAALDAWLHLYNHHRAQRPSADQPRQQRPWLLQLAGVLSG